MRIYSKNTITRYIEENPDAGDALRRWYFTTLLAEWQSFAEMKKDFNSVDAVGNDHYVFNIKGNHYRLIAEILFPFYTVYIRFIGTHKEYDKIIDIQNI